MTGVRDVPERLRGGVGLYLLWIRGFLRVELCDEINGYQERRRRAHQTEMIESETRTRPRVPKPIHLLFALLSFAAQF